MRPIVRLRAMPMFTDANPCDCDDLRQVPCSSIASQSDRRTGGWITSAGGTGGGWYAHAPHKSSAAHNDAAPGILAPALRRRPMKTIRRYALHELTKSAEND
jgi:hypothetical protein